MFLFVLSLILLAGGLMVVNNSWAYIILRTWRRDLKALIRFIRVNYYLITWELRNMTVPKLFEKTVDKYPHKVAFYFEEEVWTFKRLNDYSNRVANYFLSQGFKRDDCVALLLESRPEYVCFWLGLNKIGVVTALINTNLTGEPLAHSIDAAKSRAIIYGSQFLPTLRAIESKTEHLKKYEFRENETISKELVEKAEDIRTCLNESPITSVESHIHKGNLKDCLLYVYTSGTTGLPKAAVITHIRFLFMVIGLNSMAKVRENDCIYNSLPLYHTAGGVVGVGQALICGTTVTIRKKFSASNFWKDCNEYRCTIAQYIGETCRYLLAAHSDTKVKHKVRAMFGNGLKPQIWKQFVKKFEIAEIFEFYGATEGNSNLVNIDSTVGAVGFVPVYARFLYPVCLIKCDEATGEPIKNKDGWYISCKANEPGVLIGRISTSRAINQFTGYADKEATQKKILMDVFKRGDMYFNTGDVLIYDDFGYFYFKDRTGDTFRWKGENVSTSEVEAVISNIVNLNDAIVYGVEVPGTEGRAGMVAIVDPDKSIDMEQLGVGIRKRLPVYSQPLFVRIMSAIELTGTFKLIKRDLVADGYDINKIKDAIYFHDPKLKKYIPLTKDIYESITKGRIRL